jgi:dTDP-4-dehydrorhamnose 3,5-epimerase
MKGENKMKSIETSLPEVWTLEPAVFGDARGFFMETFSAQKFAALGLQTNWVQDNHSLSSRGTLRGLHYQLQNPQAKLCRVVRGAVLDVAVDIRRGSPHFGKYVAVELSAENKRQILVPRGFAHGFLVLSEEAEFLYKCDDFYTPGDEYGLAWDDDQIGIEWNLSALGLEAPLLSGKDSVTPRLRDIAPENLPVY